MMDIPEEFYRLTGKMRFTMLNDAMFHIVLEANPELLKSLVCSLLVAEATKTMYRVSAEEQARRLCEAAERYESEQRTYEEVIAEQENILSNQKSKIAEQKGKITEQESTISEQAVEIARLKVLLENK